MPSFFGEFPVPVKRRRVGSNAGTSVGERLGGLPGTLEKGPEVGPR
jgi:hypothetical protein